MAKNSHKADCLREPAAVTCEVDVTAYTMTVVKQAMEEATFYQQALRNTETGIQVLRQQIHTLERTLLVMTEANVPHGGTKELLNIKRDQLADMKRWYFTDRKALRAALDKALVAYAGK